MIQWLRDQFTPEQRSIIGAEAAQSLQDRHWKEAFEGIESYLIEQGKACDPDNKDKAQRIILSLQLLEAIQRELHRKVQDGELARVQMAEIEARSRPVKFYR